MSYIEINYTGTLAAGEILTIDGVEKTFHEAHQDLWNELSQNPGMTKGDWFEKHEVQGFIWNHCFACDFTSYGEVGSLIHYFNKSLPPCL